MKLLARLLIWLTPDHHKHAAASAERDAVDSRLAWREAAASAEAVNDVTRRMAMDRQRNHYADRFAAALGRDHA